MGSREAGIGIPDKCYFEESSAVDQKDIWYSVEVFINWIKMRIYYNFSIQI